MLTPKLSLLVLSCSPAFLKPWAMTRCAVSRKPLCWAVMLPVALQHFFGSSQRLLLGHIRPMTHAIGICGPRMLHGSYWKWLSVCRQLLVWSDVASSHFHGAFWGPWGLMEWVLGEDNPEVASGVPKKPLLHQGVLYHNPPRKMR